jgi:hypothetical protein
VGAEGGASRLGSRVGLDAREGWLLCREGAIIFRDIADKLDVLRVERDKCGRVGQYRAARRRVQGRPGRLSQRARRSALRLVRADKTNQSVKT